MTLTPQQRRELVIGHGGALLSNCTRLTEDQTRAYVECYVDGSVNALMRLVGAKEAATFAYAAADRAVANLREPTDLRFDAEPAAAASIALAPAAAPPRHSALYGWMWGVIQTPIVWFFCWVSRVG